MVDKHKQAEKDYMKGMKYKDIAEKYGVSLNTVKSWKRRYGWSRQKGAPSENGVHTKKRGGQPGNKNALGNRGGAAPKGNSNAVKHGFFRTIFPDDEETLAVVEAINEKDPLDILWENIVIQYTAIVRAQKLMFVRDQDDTTKVLRREKSRDSNKGSEYEVEYELQFAWDKHANFLQAQSRAMATLQGMIKRYEEMAQAGLATEEQRLRIEKLKVEIDAIKAAKSEQSAEDWVEALKKVAAKRKNGGDAS